MVEITISGKHFNTKQEAISYFEGLISLRNKSNKVLKGEALFDDLEEVYTQYTKNTNRDLAKIEKLNYFDFEPVIQKVPPFPERMFPSHNLVAVFQDESKDRFSIREAIQSIANETK